MTLRLVGSIRASFKQCSKSVLPKRYPWLIDLVEHLGFSISFECSYDACLEGFCFRYFLDIAIHGVTLKPVSRRRKLRRLARKPVCQVEPVRHRVFRRIYQTKIYCAAFKNCYLSLSSLIFGAPKPYLHPLYLGIELFHASIPSHRSKSPSFDLESCVRLQCL